MYDNGIFSYIILSENVLEGNKIYSGVNLKNFSLSLGSATSLKNIPLFSIVNNVESRPFKGAMLSRAAGTGSVIFLKMILKSH